MVFPTSIELPDHLASFVSLYLHNGQFASADEMVIAGLRLLEEHQLKLANLRKALAAGEESGYVTNFDFDAFIAEPVAADRAE